MLSYVWAEDEKGAIGYQGRLPWHLPADLAHFKAKTMGHPMLMGRKTFESLPGLLPGRQHVVLSTRKLDLPAGVLQLKSEEEVSAWLKEQAGEVCVIGGSSLFALLADQVDKLEVTRIKGIFPADTYMSNLDWAAFALVKSEAHQADGKNKYDYVFETYLRKK
ncbi:dihydrofolate reductase [Lactobacillus delbrueckii]|uniref:dihydrofolate reductase n=1 Tax=Lactobacillus delbrueckii TaxID=1584 RepID=UPI00177AC788|nr:dihydrofolate reductase [Lactobacillus delbrueckii]MBD5834596.1 dihydrofolate reductase [Lactobacillus delbrueckii]MBM6987876.1 dihydrofolate reductase [Lactobacillus delbrueckii]MCD5505388.1 dihydrofolate reductase [Lactobacillus delbrueckii subsp. lactis]